jgi:hypothetical protein
MTEAVQVDEFATLLKVAAYDQTIADVMRLLEDPPGRAPQEPLRQASKWYRSLDSGEQGQVEYVTRVATHAAIYAVLDLLDGVRVSSRWSVSGEFELWLRLPDGTYELVSGPDRPFLHETFGAVAQP